MHADPTGIPAIARGARASAPPYTGGGTTILLGDRNDDVHAMYGIVLERHGFAVLHARSPAECLRLVRARRVCAAIVSVGTRGMLRWTSYHQLARAAGSAGIALISLTTDPRVSTDTRRHRRCAAAVLMLPCAPEELAGEVERALHEARRAAN